MCIESIVYLFEELKTTSVNLSFSGLTCLICLSSNHIIDWRQLNKLQHMPGVYEALPNVFDQSKLSNLLSLFAPSNINIPINASISISFVGCTFFCSGFLVYKDYNKR